MSAASPIPERVFAETVLDFLAPLRAHLDDPACSEILVNGPDEVWIERRGKLARSNARFASAEALEAAVRHVAQYAGKSLGPAHPILEARLPDGSRVEAVLPPASRRGACVAIRRFPKETLTMERLRTLGAISPEACEALRLAVALAQNIVVAGGTGSGKTSMLNALGAYVPEGERVVVIEDASEIQLQLPHVVYLEARPAGPGGQGEVTIRQLLRATLRLRPDRIVLGEIRAGESLDLIQAMTSGHGGCLSTVHATYPADTLRRLETMALMSDVELPLEALRAQVGSAVNLIVQVARMGDGSRKVTHVTQCLGFAPGEGYRLVDLYLFRHRGADPATGKVRGALEPTRNPTPLADALLARGHTLPEGLVPTQAEEQTR
ncbi:MAG: ATPase, T2SS/T4P/T4SS family [Myxococcota bacterium]